MALDAQRAMLDALMGRDRNLGDEEKKNIKRHFSDEEICKFYLCGLCPYQLFKNTKSDLGSYDKLLDDKMKAQWEETPQEEKDKYGYERDLLDFLSDLVADLDRRVARNKARIEQEEEAELKEQGKLLETLSDVDRTRLFDISKEMTALTTHARELGEEGKVDEAYRVMSQMEALKSERIAIEQKLSRPLIPNDQKKLVLCEVSGNFLSSTDSAERLRAHFEGKQYKGWKAVRDKYESLLAKSPPKGIKGYSPDYKERSSSRRSSRERGRGRRDRDRDRRDRGRRDRDRDRRGSRRRSRSRGRR